MKNLRMTLAILVTKIATFVLRLVKSGGTSLPGKLAIKLYPGILYELAGKFRVIMITGTNGKTTTSRIVASMLDQAGLAFITNKSGANLSSGVTSTLLNALTWRGEPKVPYALLETDEAAFKTLAARLKPEIAIVTNFFRDQLDRYGELYTTLNNVREGIRGTPATRLILNADDSLCASLAKDIPNEIIFFGMAKGVYPETKTSMNNDAAFCISCKTRYAYDSISYGHLGHFSCPTCGYERPHAHLECSAISSFDQTGSSIEIHGPGVNLSVRLMIPGLYNVYNALAGASLGYAMDLPPAKITQALQSFELGFGRMEAIPVGDKKLKVILVKNPTGFNQVLRYLQTQQDPCVVSLAINDKLADGTDISWLWDVDFELLADIQEKIRAFYVSGIRAEDMAVRLKYAGVLSDRIHIEKNFNTFISQSLDKTASGETCHILPTYTAMLDIRNLLKSRFGLKEFWK